MTKMMQAMVLTGHGDFDRLEWRAVSQPALRAGEVLIEVKACGLNNTDVNTRTAWYSKGTRKATTGESLEGVAETDASWGGAGLVFPRIQGADVAGMVVSAGGGVDPALVGRRVVVDPWQRDAAEPLNMEKAKYLGSEIDGGFCNCTRMSPSSMVGMKLLPVPKYAPMPTSKTSTAIPNARVG
mgnify:CR=1 FL=1